MRSFRLLPRESLWVKQSTPEATFNSLRRRWGGFTEAPPPPYSGSQLGREGTPGLGADAGLAERGPRKHSVSDSSYTRGWSRGPWLSPQKLF